jgi:hypothetical protein
MRRLLFAPLLLLSCSDYDLGKTGDEPNDRPPKDTSAPDTDTDTTGRDTHAADSGGVTVPDTDEPTYDLPDGKVDVVLIVDVTYVYDCYHADVATHTSAVVAELLGSGANVAVAIASFDDYQVDGEWWASFGGLPYKLDQQLTTDLTRLQSAAAGLSLEWGGDGPGTGLEAIAQVADGDGYDQDCDGRYDSTTDIKPFNARSTDAFGGSVNGTAVESTPGTGTRSGVGWRDGSKKVVVVLAENAFRDRNEGHGTPSGACTPVVTRTAAINALTAADAKFLGVNAYEFQDIDPLLQEQLEEIAQGTSSKIDADHDGARDDVAVLAGDWDWPATPILTQAIFDLVR